MRALAQVIATAGFVGYVPVAPGTFGSAVGVAVWLLVVHAGATAELAAIGLSAILGVWSAGVVERHAGKTDPGMVVIDEVLGMLMTLAWIPLTPLGVFVAFLVFRAFDVVKPWPASKFEALPGGWGIMADDAMAGVYGNLAMRVLVAVAPAGYLA
jgi:phosphatidylglycerophosphatase A